MRGAVGGSDAGEGRLDRRNCKETQYSREKRMGQGRAGFGRKQHGSESEVNYLWSLGGMLGK